MVRTFLKDFFWYMLVSIGSTQCFLGYKEREELTRLVLHGRTPREFVDELLGAGTPWLDAWELVSREIHRRIVDHLKREAFRGAGVALHRFVNFQYQGEDAKRNVLDVLHAASLVSRQLRIVPLSKSLSEDIHNRIALGTQHHALAGDEATLLFNVRPRSRLGWLFNDEYDSEIDLRVSEVEAVLGPLAHPTIAFRGVEFKFGSKWSARLRSMPAIGAGAR